ncbi:MULTISPECIES: hypothetical protein [Photobacterium]|nr:MULTISPECIES: hypothetical protein [Photobacterium]MDO6583213.1 hypothetical protein [Photobacterium sp. 2_MG-2023]MDO6709044.1 hypothetical protein [Photobacterium sp. 1_MG-2023]
MKKEHKVMLITVVVTLLIIAVINNVSSLKTLKETIYGDGWF